MVLALPVSIRRSRGLALVWLWVVALFSYTCSKTEACEASRFTSLVSRRVYVREKYLKARYHNGCVRGHQNISDKFGVHHIEATTNGTIEYNGENTFER